MTFRVGTIIARNYLPLARILARSLAHHHPDVRLAALVFDDRDGTVEAEDEPFDALTLEDLGDDVDELLGMAGLYDVTELATALKPWLLDRLLDDADAALYLDPDIEVFSPVDRLAALAREHGVVLTPHAVLPMPRDGRRTDETTILAAGVYNLGFIGVGPAARRSDGDRPAFLDFWKERLRRECLTAPLGMRFVDQRWIDFVPGIYDPAIVRDPTCNVAYWNLDGRILTWDGDDDPPGGLPPEPPRPPGTGTYRIDGAPLTFFHFSGYKPTSPHLLSTHQAEPPRILLSERPDLRRITGEYGALLMAAGYGVGDPPPYGFATMANGIPVDAAVRKILRDLTAAADAGHGPVPPSPWTTAGAAALTELLCRPPTSRGDPGRLSIYLATVFAQRVDELRPRFFDPQVADRTAFLTWARSEAAAGRLPAALVPPDTGVDDDRLPLADSQWTPGDRLAPGTVVAVDPTAPTGALAALRAVVGSARDGGLDHATFVAPTPGGDRPPLLTGGDDRRDHRVALVAAGAGGSGPPHPLTAAVGPGFAAARRVVVVVDWPLAAAPADWFDPFAPLDPAEVWTTSEVARRALAPVCDVPVYALPFRFPEAGPFVAAVEVEGDGDGDAGPWTVGTYVDLSLPPALTNPEGLIEAFTAAFPTPGAARLVVTVGHAAGRTADLERLRVATATRPDAAVVVDDHDGPAWRQGLDCVASLHRGDGSAWMQAAAAGAGLPVVATSTGEGVELAGDGTVPVPGVEVAVSPGAVGLSWIDPDLPAAVDALRQLQADRDEGRRIGSRGRQQITDQADPDHQTAFVVERVTALDGSLTGDGATPDVPSEAGSSSGRSRLGRVATRLGTRSR